MPRIGMIMAAALALGAAGTVPALAQQSGSGTQAQGSIGVPTIELGGAEGTATANAGQGAGAQMDLRASRMIGQQIHSSAGNPLGTVSEILVAPAGDTKVVIETADDLRNLGVEKQTVVVTLSEIDYAPVSDELVYKEPVEALQAAPEWLQD